MNIAFIQVLKLNMPSLKSVVVEKSVPAQELYSCSGCCVQSVQNKAFDSVCNPGTAAVNFFTSAGA